MSHDIGEWKYIWSCLWILLQFAKQTYVVCLGGTLLIKFETQMPINPRFVFLIRLCKNFWASHISSEFPFICSFPIYFPVESAKNCEPPISLQVFISVFISIWFSFEFKNKYFSYHLPLFSFVFVHFHLDETKLHLIFLKNLKLYFTGCTFIMASSLLWL